MTELIDAFSKEDLDIINKNVALFLLGFRGTESDEVIRKCSP